MILFDIKTENKPRGGRAASLRGGHRLKGSEALREFGAFSPFRGESGREEAFSGSFLGREKPSNLRSKLHFSFTNVPHAAH